MSGENHDTDQLMSRFGIIRDEDEDNEEDSETFKSIY